MRGALLAALLVLTESKAATKEGPTAPKGLGVTIQNQLQPTLKLCKQIDALGTSLALGCSADLGGRTVEFDAACRDTLVGGQFKLTSARQLEWSKMWLFPGLTDAATRVQVRSALDLRTGKADAEVKLGLRRLMSKRGLSLVHRVPLDLRTDAVRASVDFGATITVPDELKIGTAEDAGLRQLADAARVVVDLDRLELRLDL
jgi:hypothetical protein